MADDDDDRHQNENQDEVLVHSRFLLWIVVLAQASPFRRRTAPLLPRNCGCPVQALLVRGSSVGPAYDRIIPVAAKWVAAQKPPSGLRTAPQHSVALHGFHRVIRTRRYIPTRRRKHRRKVSLVTA